MHYYNFKEAEPVWGTGLKNRYNQFLGFFTKIRMPKSKEMTVAIAARTYYRLFVNGVLYSCGPARAARGYCRVDELHIDLHDLPEKKSLCTAGSCAGEPEEKQIQTEMPDDRKNAKFVSIAVEVDAYSKPDGYCNDNTMEPGLLACEISDRDGEVLAATGREGEFWYTELGYRKPDVETMSHSRGIIEWYQMKVSDLEWISGRGDWKRPEVITEQVGFLKRHAPMATLKPMQMEHLTELSDLKYTKDAKPGFVLTIAEQFNPKWYAQIPKENKFLLSLRGLKREPYSGTVKVQPQKSVTLLPGNQAAELMFENEVSSLGFVDFEICVVEKTTVDLVNSDHLSYEGDLRANTYVTRWQLEPGRYHLITAEPKLVRYLAFQFHTAGKVVLEWPQILDDSYPDDGTGSFSCDDGDLNRIYEGAKRTLRLSTLDIFMDCPQRERGGWLCDSYFSAEAAWMLFGNLGTERDFLENFMLTEHMWHNFFPEVYPASKADLSDPGFINWSYWLALEVCEYYRRSGDEEAIHSWERRLSDFVDGLLSLRGKSGLIETTRSEFVDWSLANRDFAIRPISVPNNCLAVLALENLGKLYQRQEWLDAASQMRNILKGLDEDPGIFGGGGDAARWKDGKLARTDCATEGGQALEVFSGFHREDRIYLERFVQAEGPCPKFRADPNLGRSNLFIGLMIRWKALSMLNETDILVRELKSVYLEELRLGSGTFFENVNALSGCHGFNGMAGALLVETVLGLGEPEEGAKIVRIEPHPGQLRYASGTAGCSDGMILVRWQADHNRHVLDVRYHLPDGWKMQFCRSFELSGWKIVLNGQEVREMAL